MRHTVKVLLMTCLAIPLVASSHTSVAHAEGQGLDFSGTFNYTVDPVAGVVHVAAELDLANNDPTAREQRICYYGFSLAVPLNATRFANASTNPAYGAPRPESFDVALRPPDSGGDYQLAEILLQGCIRFGQSGIHTSLSYDFPGGAPRSPGSERMNASLISFPALGIGRPTNVTIRVVLPPGYSVATLDSPWVRTTEGNQTIYTLPAPSDPDTVGAFVAARNDSELVSTPLTTEGGPSFDVRAWPDDPVWGAFVTDHVTTGVPTLEELVGEGWPVEESVTLTESVSPAAYGYAGWFNTGNSTIELGEALDERVVLHELTHAWFNDDWFAERWLTEGFAEVYANLAAVETGSEPTPPTPISLADPSLLPLAEWADAAEASDTDRFAYDASYWLVQQIVDEIGVEKMRLVIDRIASDSGAYSNTDGDNWNDNTGWKRFLDLVELVGGSTTATDLMVDYVAPTTATAAAQLDERAAAQDVYSTLVEHSGDWSAPSTVTGPMERWDFDKATTEMALAEDVLTVRAQLELALAPLDMAVPQHLRAAYEDGDDLAGTADEMRAHLAAAIVLAEASAAESGSHGIFGTIGLVGDDLAGTLDKARAAFDTGDLDVATSRATDVIDAVETETTDGLQRTGAAVLAILLLAAVWMVATRLRRKPTPQTDAPSPTTDEHLDDLAPEPS